jgi:general stress protein 26
MAALLERDTKITPAVIDDNPKKCLFQLLSNFETAMMVSECGRTHQLHARPMVVARIDEDLNLWFFTELCAPKLQELKLNEHLCATFQDANKWISLSGKARISNDKRLALELWNQGGDTLHRWFPEGKRLEELTLLELETEWGEYWDSTGVMKPLQYSVEALKSVVKGERMDVSKTRGHAKLSLDSSSSTTGPSAQ